jgi:hypothetical protein
VIRIQEYGETIRIFWIFTESLYYQFMESELEMFQATDEKISNAMNHTAMLTLEGVIDTVEDSNLDEATKRT